MTNKRFLILLWSLAACISITARNRDYNAQMPIIDSLIEQKEYRKVIEMGMNGLQEARRTNDKLLEAGCDLALSMAYRGLGEVEKADSFALQCYLVDKNRRFQQGEEEKTISEQEHQLKVQRIVRYVLIAILGVSFIVGAIFIWLIYILRKRNIRLKKMNRINTLFFSLASHDLKNPVSAQRKILKLMTQNINQLSKDEIRQYGTLLLQSSDTISSQLQNIVDWSRIEIDPNANLVRIDFPFNEVIDELERSLKTFCVNKEQTLAVNLPEDITVNGDMALASTVMYNIVSNAIKFSPRGSTITIDAKEQEERWLISVKDQGRGLSEKVMEHLFELKPGKSMAGTEGESGCGMGLVISKKLLLRMDGDITASNNADGGACFTVSFKKGETI